MKHFGIQEPCSENWNTMTPSEKGAFCQKCAQHVHDFTNKSGDEIKQTLRALIGQPVCARITQTQEAALNAEVDAWMFQSRKKLQSALVFSLIVVFGLTLFSCSDKRDEQQIEQIRATAIKAVQHVESPEAAQSRPAVAKTRVVPEVFEAPYPEAYAVAVDFPEQVIEEVEIVAPNRESYYLGGAGYSYLFETYLEETVPVVEEELDENGVPYPTAFESIVFPNPAATSTTFGIAVPVKNTFEIGLYDLNGKLLRTIHSGEIDRGHFRKEIDLSDLTPGMYIVAILSKEYKETVKLSKI